MEHEFRLLKAVLALNIEPTIELRLDSASVTCQLLVTVFERAEDDRLSESELSDSHRYRWLCLPLFLRMEPGMP